MHSRFRPRFDSFSNNKPERHLPPLPERYGRDMKPQPVSSTQEVLAGLVERVTFHNTENGFCVLRAKARGHRDLVTVVGHAAAIAAGEWISASLGAVSRDYKELSERERRVSQPRLFLSTCT
jgi:hypothetical protein